MKKLLAIALASLVSTGVMASPTGNVKMVKLNEGISNFSFEPSSSSSLPFSNCFIYSQKPTTVIFYVNKFRKQTISMLPPVASDPVMLNCNGVHTLINPGSSAVCTLTPDSKLFDVCYGISKEFDKNGADGFEVMVNE